MCGYPRGYSLPPGLLLILACLWPYPQVVSSAKQAADEEPVCAAGSGSAACKGANGAVPGGFSKEFPCIMWRQTTGCNPHAPREKGQDRSCREEIPTGNSGYCQCGVGEQKRMARAVTCDHRPFKCETECMQVERYACVGWRQTRGCKSDGEREQRNDKPCEHLVDASASGYCECGAGRIVRRPGCETGQDMDPFRCRDVCLEEPDLYEDLDVDRGASEKAIKQAFRKLSLKYHPDKTQGDPVLTARFAAIREAYDVVGDQAQRALYDTVGLKMLLEAKSQKAEKGPAMNANVEVDLAVLYTGGQMETTMQVKTICRNCAQKQSPRCKKCNVGCAQETELRNVRMGPMTVKQQVLVPSKEKCKWTKTPLLLDIEPGMSGGDTLQFPHRGEQQPKKIPGDIMLTLKAKENRKFRRTGLDLHTEIHINLREALLGFERIITHLDQHSVELSVHGVTKPLAIIKIADEGMPQRSDATIRGSLFVKCIVVMPDDGEQWLRENAPPSK